MSSISRAGSTHLRAGALTAAALAAALLTGCGGSSTNANTLTHTQLTARANAACRTANVTAARVPPPDKTAHGLAVYAQQLSPIVTQLIGTLDGLAAGSTDRPPLQHYIAALRTGKRALAVLGTAATPAGVAQADAILSAQQLPKLAHDLGATACAAGP